MAISQLPQAPYRQDRKTFPTALSTDVLFSEIRDCTIVDFPEYGTPHPNTRKWPDHKLVFIKPVDIERNEIFEFFYAADRVNQDLYNFAFGYRNIIGNVGGREFRNVQRMYVTARESFAPYDVPFGAPMPNVPEDKFEGVDYVFFDRQQQKIDQPELDSLYVVEVHTYVETAFLDDNLSYSSQRDDGLPEKFKIAIPQQQTETMVAGLAEMPVLATGELSRSEDQLNPNVKLVKKLTRDLGTAPVLNSKVVTNVLQVASIEESIVDDGATITASALTVDGSVESLGNGKSVKKVITAPELFTAPSFSVQRPDVTPEKFRVAIPTVTTEESVAGTAAQPTLVAGELAATEQQVNVFVKRKTKTKRNAANSTTLAQTATDNTKQLATVTETYQTGDTDELPSATVDITSEALGDGTYVVRKVEVPEVFAAPSFSTQRPDVTPEKFRVAIPTETTEESVAGTAAQPTLVAGEIAATEQQVNVFVKRKTKTKRNAASSTTLAQKATDNTKQLATVTETYQTGDTNELPSATVDITSEALGDGTYVVRKVELPEVFAAPSFSTQRPDVTPEKFRVAIPTETTEESVAGIAAQPTLVAGEIAATEQQVNVFVKRKQKTKRNAANSTTLAQTATDNTKQLATVTETYQTGDTDELPSATVDITSEALGDGTYVVRKVEVPEVFAAPSFSTQRPDVTPEKFRVAIPTETTEESVAGIAAQPTLVAGELAATEQQVNVFVKRKQKTKRNAASSTTLAQKATDNTKQLATVTETYQTGDTTLTPSATVDITSEALGDGTYVVRKVEVPEVFAAPSFSTQRPDVTPEKFRVAIPTITTEESLAGTASPPTLGTGELAATEQQVNVFVKRKQKTTRNAASSTTLTQKATDNTKQLATVTEIYQTGDTTLTPSATVDITSEALGDGTYVVRKVEVPTLFDAASYSAQKPDVVPERFRPQTPVTTTKKLKAGTAAAPTLAAGELVKSEQQVNKFVYEEQISGRATINDVVLPTANKAYVEGAIASVTEKLSTSSAIEQGLNISDSTSTAIGDGKFIVQTVKVDQWPTLLSSEWDHQLNTQVQRSEQFVAPSSSFTEPNTAYRAVNKDRSLKVTEVEPADALSDYHLSFPVQVDVQLPNVLKSISVVWADEHADGSYDSEWNGNAGGESYSLSGSENASADGSYTLKPELIYNIEQPWGSDVSATVHYFYLKSNNNSVSESAFLSRLSEFAAGAQRWPTFKPQSHTIVLQGTKVSVSARCNAAASKSHSPNGYMSDVTQGSGKSFDLGVQLSAVSLPPTIHPAMVITEAVQKTALAKARCDVAWTGFNFPSVNVVSDIAYELNADVNPKTLEATVPSEIPLSGNYVLKSSIEPYKWGWAKCSAVVLDAATLHS